MVPWGPVPQGTCAADLYRHPQLDADIEAVKEIYSENAVAVRWVHPPPTSPCTRPCHPRAPNYAIPRQPAMASLGTHP